MPRVNETHEAESIGAIIDSEGPSPTAGMQVRRGCKGLFRFAPGPALVTMTLDHLIRPFWLMVAKAPSPTPGLQVSYGCPCALPSNGHSDLVARALIMSPCQMMSFWMLKIICLPCGSAMAAHKLSRYCILD